MAVRTPHSTAHQPPAPLLGIGAAIEDWTGDARFYEYSVAVDPVGTGVIPPVAVARFPADVHHGPGTRSVPLDCSARLGVDYPATTPAMLAAFVVLDPGDTLATAPDSTSELYVCIEGSGTSTFAADDARGPRAGGSRATTGTLPWATGDVWTLPGGCTTEHTAASPGPALLYRVTDAPLLAYLGATPGPPRFAPTRYDAAASQAHLADVARHPDAGARNRVSILLGNAALPRTLTATHTLWAMLGILPPGQVQRPHRHQSAAVDLITVAPPGCYTMVGSELDASGGIADPVRVEWESEGVFVTPPGLWHSHHNTSDEPAYLVPIQDAGLHTYLRSLDIRFTSPGR